MMMVVKGPYQGTIAMGQEATVASYEGHEFFFTLFDDKTIEVARFKMVKEQYMYVLLPTTDEERAIVPKDLFDDHDKHMQFMEEYFNRTGLHWRHYFGEGKPRPPPSLFMWPADQVGQTHQVESSEGFWKCNGPSSECQTTGGLTLNMTVVSMEPRVFHIPDFLSDFECDAIIEIAASQVKVSQVGNYATGAFASDTRTSKNAWVGRKVSDVTESLYHRAAELLKINDDIMRPGINAEDMQVVTYKNGQKYDPHHDWGSHGVVESRFITLLLYLTDQEDPEAGGETSFPKGMNGTGFKVPPVKGNAVLFYNLLEDGNGDDLALHAAMPVYRGQKWLANFWVWDPKRS